MEVAVQLHSFFSSAVDWEVCQLHVWPHYSRVKNSLLSTE